MNGSPLNIPTFSAIQLNVTCEYRRQAAKCCRYMNRARNDQESGFLPLPMPIIWSQHPHITPFYLGIHLADAPGAAISPPWDFSPKLLVFFARFFWKGEFLEQRRVKDVRFGYVRLGAPVIWTRIC